MTGLTRTFGYVRLILTQTASCQYSALIPLTRILTNHALLMCMRIIIRLFVGNLLSTIPYPLPFAQVHGK